MCCSRWLRSRAVKADGRVLIRGHRETSNLACLGWVRKLAKAQWTAHADLGAATFKLQTPFKTQTAACRFLWRLRHPTTASRAEA